MAAFSIPTFPPQSQTRHRRYGKLIVEKFTLCIIEQLMKAIYSWESRKVTGLLCIFSNRDVTRSFYVANAFHHRNRQPSIACRNFERTLQSNTRVSFLNFYVYGRHCEFFHPLALTWKTRQTKTLLSFNFLSIISALVIRIFHVEILPM